MLAQLEDAEARGELNEESIKQILPNTSWITVICGHCMTEQEKVVQMGKLFTSRYYCRTCLHEAMELLNQ